MRIVAINSKATVLHDQVTGARPFQLPTDPATPKAIVDYGWADADLKFMADKPVTLQGLALYRVDENDDMVNVGQLNDGEPIVIQQAGAAIIGWAMPVSGVAMGQRLFIGEFGAFSTTDATAKITVTLTPLRTAEETTVGGGPLS